MRAHIMPESSCCALCVCVCVCARAFVAACAFSACASRASRLSVQSPRRARPRTCNLSKSIVDIDAETESARARADRRNREGGGGQSGMADRRRCWATWGRRHEAPPLAERAIIMLWAWPLCTRTYGHDMGGKLYKLYASHTVLGQAASASACVLVCACVRVCVSPDTNAKLSA